MELGSLPLTLGRQVEASNQGGENFIVRENHLDGQGTERCGLQPIDGGTMADTSVHKVNSATSPKGKMGQKYLACGVSLAMRLWEVEPGKEDPPTERDYETVGYVIKGRAELHLGEQLLLLEPGDSWVVPHGARHSYRILESFSAVEATHPPAVIHARDEKNA